MVRLLLRVGLPLLLCLAYPPVAARADEIVVLAVPYRSQLDDSPFARSNCGPASLAMVLGTFGVEVPTDELRDRVNAAQGTWDDVTSGTAITVMAGIARQYGLRSLDLTAGRALRRWTLDDVRHHVQEGRPVVAQLWYPGLPGRANAAYRGDHYIVLVGFEGEEFFYHDPVSDVVGGANRRISADELTAAWEQGDLPFAGLAFAGPVGQPAAPPRPIRPPTRTPTRAPTRTPTPSPTPTMTPTPTPSPTPTPTTTPTSTPSPSPSPTVSPTPSPTVTITPTSTSTATPLPTPAPSATPAPPVAAPTPPPSAWPAAPIDGGGLVALGLTALALLSARGLARLRRGLPPRRRFARHPQPAGD